MVVSTSIVFTSTLNESVKNGWSPIMIFCLGIVYEPESNCVSLYILDNKNKYCYSDLGYYLLQEKDEQAHKEEEGLESSKIYKIYKSVISFWFSDMSFV